MLGWIQPGRASVKVQARPVDRLAVATGVAILIHAVGLAGIHLVNRHMFIAMTPVNLAIMQMLAWWTRGTDRIHYGKAFVSLFFLGMAVEWVGVRTGLLFGTYAYGDLLGPKLDGVPLLIGGNWFLVLIGSLGLVIRVRDHLTGWSRYQVGRIGAASQKFIIPLSAAGVATFFDRFMEPAAMRLGFWSWAAGNVPVYNYICWFLLSFLAFWWGGDRLRPVASPFTSRLLLIQAVFFFLVV